MTTATTATNLTTLPHSHPLTQAEAVLKRLVTAQSDAQRPLLHASPLQKVSAYRLMSDRRRKRARPGGAAPPIALFDVEPVPLLRPSLRNSSACSSAIRLAPPLGLALLRRALLCV